MLQNIDQNVMAGDLNCTLKPNYDRAIQFETHKHSFITLFSQRIMPYRLLPTCEPYYKALYMAEHSQFCKIRPYICFNVLLVHHARFQIMTVLMQSFVCQVQVERKAIGSSMCLF